MRYASLGTVYIYQTDDRDKSQGVVEESRRRGRRSSEAGWGWRGLRGVRGCRNGNRTWVLLQHRQEPSHSLLPLLHLRQQLQGLWLLLDSSSCSCTGIISFLPGDEVSTQLVCCFGWGCIYFSSCCGCSIGISGCGLCGGLARN